jgi:hypothetical protein
MSEIITFPGHSPKRAKTAAAPPNYTERRKNRKNMRQFLFRSYNLIAESDEAELMSASIRTKPKSSSSSSGKRYRQRGSIQRRALKC